MDELLWIAGGRAAVSLFLAARAELATVSQPSLPPTPSLLLFLSCPPFCIDGANARISRTLPDRIRPSAMFCHNRASGRSWRGGPSICLAEGAIVSSATFRIGCFPTLSSCSGCPGDWHSARYETTEVRWLMLVCHVVESPLGRHCWTPPHLASVFAGVYREGPMLRETQIPSDQPNPLHDFLPFHKMHWLDSDNSMTEGFNKRPSSENLRLFP